MSKNAFADLVEKHGRKRVRKIFKQLRRDLRETRPNGAGIRMVDGDEFSERITEAVRCGVCELLDDIGEINWNLTTLFTQVEDLQRNCPRVDQVVSNEKFGEAMVPLTNNVQILIERIGTAERVLFDLQPRIVALENAVRSLRVREELREKHEKQSKRGRKRRITHRNVGKGARTAKNVK